MVPTTDNVQDRLTRQKVEEDNDRERLRNPIPKRYLDTVLRDLRDTLGKGLADCHCSSERWGMSTPPAQNALPPP
ncbi:hypothetical protein CLCR_09376 [Cladophialophora carrionii]|uniref:Uncharacterized protein n=1 Tax=Cladophialophora carrionii TaxID=86049 RepID=A0A1C1CTK7_9EURO|nr:hypothetical protein CLCR_09376 [Cladophialophora carrionii]